MLNPEKLAPNTGRFEITVLASLPEDKLAELVGRIAKLTDFYTVAHNVRVRYSDEGQVEEDVIVITFDTAESFDMASTIRAITQGAAKVSGAPAYVVWYAVSGERFRP